MNIPFKAWKWVTDLPRRNEIDEKIVWMEQIENEVKS
jgi:hypothetical protein